MRRLAQARRREAKRLRIDLPDPVAPPLPAKAMCNGKVRIRDEAGELILNEIGKPTYRPCSRPPIKGMTVCIAHGGRFPVVRKAAQRRMLAMVPKAMDGLDGLLEQNDHLPTKLNAIKTVLERSEDNALGQLKKAAESNTRPVINIGIAVGGIGKKPEILIEGAIVGTDDTDA